MSEVELNVNVSCFAATFISACFNINYFQQTIYYHNSHLVLFTKTETWIQAGLFSDSLDPLFLPSVYMKILYTIKGSDHLCFMHKVNKVYLLVRLLWLQQLKIQINEESTIFGFSECGFYLHLIPCV